jgi:formate hydrogenlyase subunit 6/NADH:ubiquinone oxidoreductase subunit I
VIKTAVKYLVAAARSFFASNEFWPSKSAPQKQAKGITLLTFDADICTACGKCEDLCPFLCIEIESKDDIILKSDAIQPAWEDNEIFKMFSDVDFSQYEGIQMVKRHPRFHNIQLVNQNKMTAFKIEHFNCTACGICTFSCPTGAIYFSAEQKQVVTKEKPLVQIFSFFPVDEV